MDSRSGLTLAIHEYIRAKGRRRSKTQNRLIDWRRSDRIQSCWKSLPRPGHLGGRRTAAGGDRRTLPARRCRRCEVWPGPSRGSPETRRNTAAKFAWHGEAGGLGNSLHGGEPANRVAAACIARAASAVVTCPSRDIETRDIETKEDGARRPPRLLLGSAIGLRLFRRMEHAEGVAAVRPHEQQSILPLADSPQG